MKTTNLAIDLLVVDGDTQSRVSISEETVETYAELISDSNGEWPLGVLDVFHDGNDYLVADGFHRTLAAQRAKRGSIPCRIHKGTAKDARIFGMTANDKHGLRMTREDKRSCVEWLLDNGGKMTQKAIAETAGVSPRTVKYIVAERNPESISKKVQISPSPPRSGGDEPNDDDAYEEENPQPEPEPPTDRCPVCSATKWDEDDDGWACSKCQHPYGEPAGDQDDSQLATQRRKTVKTVGALMRALDDLNHICPKVEHQDCIDACKSFLRILKEWK